MFLWCALLSVYLPICMYLTFPSSFLWTCEYTFVLICSLHTLLHLTWHFSTVSNPRPELRWSDNRSALLRPGKHTVQPGASIAQTFIPHSPRGQYENKPMGHHRLHSLPPDNSFTKAAIIVPRKRLFLEKIQNICQKPRGLMPTAPNGRICNIHQFNQLYVIAYSFRSQQ